MDPGVALQIESLRTCSSEIFPVPDRVTDRTTRRPAGQTTMTNHIKMLKPRSPRKQSSMASPVSRLTTRLAYGVRQLPRVAWYVGHGLVMKRLSETVRKRES